MQRMCNERCKKCEGECAKRVQEMIKECAEKTEYVTIPMRPEDMRNGNCCKLGAPHHLLASLGRKIRNPPAGYPPDIRRISGYPADIRISDFPALDTGITIVNSSYMIYFNRDNNT